MPVHAAPAAMFSAPPCHDGNLWCVWITPVGSQVRHQDRFTNMRCRLYRTSYLCRPHPVSLPGSLLQCCRCPHNGHQSCQQVGFTEPQAARSPNKSRGKGVLNCPAESAGVFHMTVNSLRMKTHVTQGMSSDFAYRPNAPTSMIN